MCLDFLFFLLLFAIVLVFYLFFCFFFFFSSRRRHTRLVSDWSSDVCSSDLFLFPERVRSGFGSAISFPKRSITRVPSSDLQAQAWLQTRAPCSRCYAESLQIGRASCRERV